MNEMTREILCSNLTDMSDPVVKVVITRYHLDMLKALCIICKKKDFTMSSYTGDVIHVYDK